MFELLILVLLIIASLLFGNGFVTAVEDLYGMVSDYFKSPAIEPEITVPSDFEVLHHAEVVDADPPR